MRALAIRTALPAFLAALALAMPMRAHAADHLVISEVGADTVNESGPTSEFVEIFNPTSTPFDLSLVFLSDSPTVYYKTPENFVQGNPLLGGLSGDSDWIWRFPAGSVIQPGGIVVVTGDSDTFLNEFFAQAQNKLAAFTEGGAQLFECTSDGSADGVGDMQAGYALGSSLNRMSMTNSNETVILYYYDLTSDLVEDLDMVSWGTSVSTTNLTNKTGLDMDGPDADVLRTTFATDARTVNGAARSGSSAASNYFAGVATQGNSIQRKALTETSELAAAGNGYTGHDETTENWNDTFGVFTATPGKVHSGIGAGALGLAAQVDFGGVPFGQSAVRDVVIRNTGSVLFRVTAMQVAGAAMNEYQLSTSGLPVDVPAGGQVVRQATFTSNASFPGTRDVTVTVTTSMKSAQGVAVEGQAILTAFAAPPGAISVSATGLESGTLSFATTVSGQSRDTILTIHNTGGSNLVVSAFTIVPQNAWFSVSDTAGVTIPAGGSATRTIRFAPQGNGPALAQLQIASNSVQTPTLVVGLSGNGLQLSNVSRGGGGGGCAYTGGRSDLGGALALLLATAALFVARRRA